MRRDYRACDAVMLWSGIGFILILWSTSILKALPSDSEKGGSLAASYVEFVLAEAAALRRSAFVTFGIRALPRVFTL